MFMLPKHCIKMRALGCCLYRDYYGGEDEYLYILTSSHIPLKSTNYSSSANSSIKTHHNRHRRWREGQKKISNGEGSLGHWHHYHNPAMLLTFQWNDACAVGYLSAYGWAVSLCCFGVQCLEGCSKFCSLSANIVFRCSCDRFTFS